MIITLITIPLISSITLISLGRYIGIKGGRILSIISIILAVLISMNEYINFIYSNNIKRIILFEWLNLGINKIRMEFLLNKESILMINLISIITMIVIIYSYWYMENEEYINRFISNLLIFAVTMYILVLSNNLLILFIGWEGVGIMSCLLINYWYKSINSNKSGLKAILYNKIGDITLILSMILLLNINNNLNFPKNNNINSYIEILINIIMILIIISAMAKSAQIFLHPWLGDAMAGPTPVSALLHAATMVTAGIYLLYKFNIYIDLSSKYIKFLLTSIGIFTIIFGGITSLCQKDIKKIIAYSTCSQIGYMFINNGLYLNNMDSSLFHLITHGFFKALLFLSAGIIIHNYLHDQDIRKYGNLIYKFPLTYLFILIGTLSIIAFPFFSGYYSKDNIIENSLVPFNPIFSYFFLLLGALFTVLYSYNLFSSFFNYNSSNRYLFLNNSQEIPFLLLIPLSILLFGAIFLGYFSFDIFLGLGFNKIGIDIELYPFYIKLIPILFLIISYFIIPKFNLYSKLIGFNIFTIFNRKLFFDPIFNYLFVTPFLFLSYPLSFKFIDKGFLEFIAPTSFPRFFFSLSSSHHLSSQSYLNLNYFFIYLFFSLSLFLSLSVLLF